VRTFDRPVVMGDAAAVAGRFPTLIEAQPIIALGQVVPCIAVKVAERRREAIATGLARRTAKGPQCVQQSFCQRHITFAAENDMGVRETRVGEAEVIEPIVEPNPAIVTPSSALR
jgi:hypothetical protein